MLLSEVSMRNVETRDTPRDASVNGKPDAVDVERNESSKSTQANSGASHFRSSHPLTGSLQYIPWNASASSPQTRTAYSSLILPTTVTCLRSLRTRFCQMPVFRSVLHIELTTS